MVASKSPLSKGVISAVESILHADFSVISNSGRNVLGVAVGLSLSLLSTHTERSVMMVARKQFSQ